MIWATWTFPQKFPMISQSLPLYDHSASMIASYLVDSRGIFFWVLIYNLLIWVPNLECSLPEFNGNNSHVYLDLSETSLSDNIPLHQLPQHLNVLRFHDCSLKGKIPSSIGSLSHLTSLVLSSSKLSGWILSSIGSLSHLTILYLYSNNFAGEIPSSIQNLNQMTDLDIWITLAATFPLPFSIYKTIRIINLPQSVRRHASS